VTSLVRSGMKLLEHDCLAKIAWRLFYDFQTWWLSTISHKNKQNLFQKLIFGKLCYKNKIYPLQRKSSVRSSYFMLISCLGILSLLFKYMKMPSCLFRFIFTNHKFFSISPMVGLLWPNGRGIRRGILGSGVWTLAGSSRQP